MKDKYMLLFISIIPAIIGILSVILDTMYPGNLYALKGVSVILGYELLVALPITMIAVGKGTVNASKLPRWPW